jgi:hypothetical protein
MEPRSLTRCSTDIDVPTATDVTATTDIALRIRRLNGPLPFIGQRPRGHRPNGPSASTPRSQPPPSRRHSRLPSTEPTPLRTTAFTEHRPGCRTMRCTRQGAELRMLHDAPSIINVRFAAYRCCSADLAVKPR